MDAYHRCMSIASLAEFFGWCTLLNAVVLMVSTLFVLVARGWAARVHARMSGVSEAELPMAYFRYLAGYKIVFLAFNLVPYLALKQMS